jgi:ABC-2 type transport system ATP-binding protein
VEGIDLNIRPGEIYGFLGPNGAGKTTTIMMLLGIIRPTSGEIYLFGERFLSNRFDLKQKLGVVPEKHPAGMWKWMTAYEYLEFFADLYSITLYRQRIKDLLEKVDLLKVENKKIKEFSRGMLQKLSIVRSLLHDPDILFLDEPISGLDPMGIRAVRDLILSENREGRTIFISSHLLSEMERICQRVAIISKGKLLAEDEMDSLISKISKDRQIRVELDDLPEKVVDELKGLDFIIDLSVKGKTITVKTPRDRDYRKEISAFFIGKKLVPLGIHEIAFSLEEAFTIITDDNVDKLITH